jgi:hypothetical protein
MHGMQGAKAKPVRAKKAAPAKTETAGDNKDPFASSSAPAGYATPVADKQK